MTKYKLSRIKAFKRLMELKELDRQNMSVDLELHELAHDLLAKKPQQIEIEGGICLCRCHDSDHGTCLCHCDCKKDNPTKDQDQNMYWQCPNCGKSVTVCLDDCPECEYVKDHPTKEQTDKKTYHEDCPCVDCLNHFAKEQIEKEVKTRWECDKCGGSITTELNSCPYCITPTPPKEQGELRETCPNCIDPDPKIEPCKDGSCGVCGGQGYIVWREVGRIVDIPTPPKPEAKRVERLKMDGGNGYDEAPHYIWSNKVGNKINEIIDRLNTLSNRIEEEKK